MLCIHVETFGRYMLGEQSTLWELIGMTIAIMMIVRQANEASVSRCSMRLVFRERCSKDCVTPDTLGV